MTQTDRVCLVVIYYLPTSLRITRSDRKERKNVDMAYSAECKLLEPDSSAVALNAINARSLYLKKVGSALFYGIASFFITVVNKTVLTSWKFPSFLALSIGQMVAGIVILVSDFERANIENVDGCFRFG